MIIIGDNFFDGLQVVFGTMLVWSEVSLGASPPRGLASCPWGADPGHPVPDGSPVAGAPPVGGRGAPQPWGFKPAVGGPSAPCNN